MTPRAFADHVRREARGSRVRLTFFTLCLALGVGAVVAVAGLGASVDAGIRGEARPLLAADIAVEGHRAPPPALADALRGLRGARVTETRDLVTIVAAPATAAGPGKSQLVELRAVGDGYPFYGRLELDPRRPLSALLDEGSVVVGPALLARLGLAREGTLLVGGKPFRIAGVTFAEPGRIASAFAMGPRVFISLAGLERAGLVVTGSRVEYRTLIALAPDAGEAELATAAERVRAAAPAPQWTTMTYREAYPELREALRRTGRFLGLVALLSLVVGGIGVAETVRAWLAGRLDAIAVLKCVGMRPREILLLYVGETALLGLAGSAAGVVLGMAAQLVLPALLSGVLPPAFVDPWQWGPVARGLALGVTIALLFSLPPLLVLRRVPAARVLRRDAEPLPAGVRTTASLALALVAGVALVASWQASSWRYGTAFALGLGAATVALACAAWAVIRLVRRGAGHRGPLWLRQGLAGLARPGAGTAGAIVAIGLGVVVVLTMYLVQHALAGELGTQLPKDVPNAFLVDVQPDQWEGIERLAAASGATGIDSAPMVTARLTAVNGVPVEKIEAARKGANGRGWAFGREQRLTWRGDLPRGNVLVAGRLWSDPKAPEASLEEGFAREIGVKTGGTLSFDVQGVPLELHVTSLRKVEWRTFGINFFVLVEPGVLDQAPYSRVANMRLPPGKEQALQDALAARYPNVILVRVREILERIAGVLSRIGFAVQLLGGFTVFAGIAILGGAVSASSVRRAREVALLKTLGMTRAGVVAVFSVEYGLIGLVAAAIGAAGAAVLAYEVLTRALKLDGTLPLFPFAFAVAATILLAVLAGLAASARALTARPIEVLRDL